MSLRSTLKKLKKKTARTLKFSAKPFTAPLELAKKYPKETIALTAATFTGGAALAATAGGLGLERAKSSKSSTLKSLANALSPSEPVGETSIGFGSGGSAPSVSAPTETFPTDSASTFPPCLPKGALLVGGGLLVLLLVLSKK